MKIMVTGGAGFIGSHIVDRLIKEGHIVIIIDNLSCGKTENINSKAIFIEYDIENKSLIDIFKEYKPEIVFHLAAQKNVRTSIEQPILDAKINIIGGLNLLECCKTTNVKQIIFSSTGGALYGATESIPTTEEHITNPESPYAISKESFEKYLKFYKSVYNLDYTILRYSNVYGPRQDPKGEAGVIAIFINNLLTNKQSIIYGDGNQTRDYVYIKDVVDANIKAIGKYGTYNIGNTTETSVNELYNKICNISNINIKPIYGDTITGELQRSCLDCKKSLNILEWLPKYNLETGLVETFNYFTQK